MITVRRFASEARFPLRMRPSARAFDLVETFDVRRFEALMAMTQMPDSVRAQFGLYGEVGRRHQDGDYACVPVRYSFPPGRSLGRFSASVQGEPRATNLVAMPSNARPILLEGEAWDVDVENCQPCILRNKLDACGIPCPRLTEYCANRDACLQARRGVGWGARGSSWSCRVAAGRLQPSPSLRRLRAAQEIVAAAGVDRSAAKNLLLRLFYGGSVEAWAAEQRPPVAAAALPPFVAALADEIRTLAPVLLQALPPSVVQVARAQAEAKRSEKAAQGRPFNETGSVLAYVLQVGGGRGQLWHARGKAVVGLGPAVAGLRWCVVGVVNVVNQIPIRWKMHGCSCAGRARRRAVLGSRTGVWPTTLTTTTTPWLQ